MVDLRGMVRLRDKADGRDKAGGGRALIAGSGLCGRAKVVKASYCDRGVRKESGMERLAEMWWSSSAVGCVGRQIPRTA